MNQPTEDRFKSIEERLDKLEQQQTEPIKVTVERRQSDLEIRLDNHTFLLQELSTQSDRHTQAFVKIIETLNTHTETISALQADVARIKATQSDHGGMLQDLKATQDEHSKHFKRLETMMMQILERLPKTEG